MIPHLDLALEAAYKRSITLSINNSIQLELQYFFPTSTERAKHHQHARNVTICSCLCRNTHTTKRGLQTLSQPCRQEIPGSAMCVQNFDDSRGLAIRITYRISLRSSSLWKPRHPLLKVVKLFYHVEHFR